MRTLLISTLLFLFIQCGNTQISTRFLVLKDSIFYNNQYIYLNEISLQTNDIDLLQGFYKSLNAISLNKFDNSQTPKDRLKEKKVILKQFISSNQLSNCPIVAETYNIIATTSKWVNFLYRYNQYGNYHVLDKYILINIEDGKILTHEKLFTNPDSVLNKLNKQYLLNLKKEIINNKQNEEVIDILQDHYENFGGFTLTDLENIEMNRNENSNKIEGIRFHYNGIEGYYYSIWPSGYIELNVNDIISFLNNVLL